MINAKEMTYSDINDFNFSESSGYDVSLSTKDFSDLQRSSFYPEGSFGLSLVNQASKKEQITRATIGLGQINLADNDDLENNSNNIKELNRNIKLSQNITRDEITSSLDAHIEVDLRLLTKEGRTEIADEVMNLGGNLALNPLLPTGTAKAIEGYTGQELTWEPGDVARFKEKGNEFATSVPGALTIGKANVIDPNNPKETHRLYLIGKPLSADPKGYKPNRDQEGSLMSRTTNQIPGFNSMSVFHDKFTEETFLGKPGLLQISIIPAIPINYYGLIGKEINNLYDKPKNSSQSIGENHD